MSRARILADYVSSGDELADKLDLSGGAMTGAITTNSTFDGVDIAVRDALHAPKASPTFTGTATFSGDIVPSTPMSHRNLIINGDMQVAQRATSAVKSGNGYGGYISLDRWAIYHDGGTLAQVGYLSNDQRKAARMSATGSGELYMYQKIENGSGLVGAGEKFSVSAKMRASAGMNITLHGRYYDSATQNNIVNTDLGSDNAVTTDWATHKWEDISFTDTSQSATRDLYILFVKNGSKVQDEWLEITEVQLELGSSATPFEHRSYGDELARCQRYYQKSSNTTRMWPIMEDSGASGYRRGIVWFMQGMRATPAISDLTFYGGGTTGIQNEGPTSFTPYSNGIAAGAESGLSAWTADKEL